MRHVPISEFETNITEWIAAARDGEEIVVMEDGREALRLVQPEQSAEAKMARQRAAVEAMYAFGQRVLATRGPTTAEERIAWIKEDQR